MLRSLKISRVELCGCALFLSMLMTALARQFMN